MAWRSGPRRRITRPPLLYWPLARPFLLTAAVLAAFMVTSLLIGVLTYALARLGIAPTAAALLLAAFIFHPACTAAVASFEPNSPATPWPTAHRLTGRPVGQLSWPVAERRNAPTRYRAAWQC